MITDSAKEKVTIGRKWKRLWQRSLIWLLGTLFPVRLKNNANPVPGKILILVQEKLGDAILTTPLFKNLKTLFPLIQIHIAVFHKASDIFQNDLNIYKVHNYKADKISAIRELKRQKFDLLFNTKDHPSLTFILLSRYLNANYTVAIDHHFHKRHYHHLINVDFMAHTIEKNCALFNVFSAKPENLDLKPYFPPGVISDEVSDFVNQMPTGSIIGVNLSAGSSEKEWPAEKWLELVNLLKRKCIVFGIGNRLPDKKWLESASPHVLESSITGNIYEAAAMVSKLEMLITPSTGLLHVASCYMPKVVGLYRHDPSDHMRFAPFGVPYRKIVAADHRVSEIRVTEVAEAALELLKDNKKEK